MQLNEIVRESVLVECRKILLCFCVLHILRLVHTIRFSDPFFFSLALFQFIEMLIHVSNFFEFEYKSDPKIGSCKPAIREIGLGFLESILSFLVQSKEKRFLCINQSPSSENTSLPGNFFKVIKSPTLEAKEICKMYASPGKI